MKNLLGASLLLHGLVIFALYRRGLLKVGDPPKKKEIPSSLAVRVISEGDFRDMVDTSPALDDRLRNSHEAAPYLSTLSQRVEKQTRASGFGISDGDEHPVAVEKHKQLKSPVRDAGALWKISPEAAKVGKQNYDDDEETGSASKKGDSNFLDPSIAIGAETLLNTDEYVYAGFYDRVRREVAPRWDAGLERFRRQTPTGDGIFTTACAFFVDSDGRLEDVKIVDPSGIPALDEVAASAIRQVGRFPNPPRALKVAGGLYRVEFSFQLTVSSERIHFGLFPTAIPNAFAR